MNATTNQTMHAIVHRKYGTPDVLTYEEIARPVPGDQTLTTYMASPNQKALLALKEIVETRKLKPVIERATR